MQRAVGRTMLSGWDQSLLVWEFGESLQRLCDSTGRY